jgi:hypothetical protein
LFHQTCGLTEQVRPKAGTEENFSIFRGILLSFEIITTAQTAVIRETSGIVEVKAPGLAEWKTAAAGQTLEKASVISTGFRSTALVTIGNSTVTVRPLTRLSLEELATKQTGEQITLNLRAGRVRADVVPLRESKIAPPYGGRIWKPESRGTACRRENIFFGG